jgi:peptidoglycan hydrolase-like protein with peptidoglycan-binding domain
MSSFAIQTEGAVSTSEKESSAPPPPSSPAPKSKKARGAGPVSADRNLDYASPYVDGPKVGDRDLAKFKSKTGIDPSERGKLREWQKENGLEPTDVVDLPSVNLGVYTSADLNARKRQGKLDEEFGFLLQADRESFKATRSDPDARKAWVMDWQRKHGIPPTGVVTRETVAGALKLERAQNHKDGAVATRIEMEEEFNFYTDGVAHGHGPRTRVDREKVVAWQRKYDLEPTGEIDEATLAAGRRHHRGAGSDRRNAEGAREEAVMRLERDKRDRQEAERKARGYDEAQKIMRDGTRR